MNGKIRPLNAEELKRIAGGRIWRDPSFDALKKIRDAMQKIKTRR
ncbi:hypothetical protein [Mixta intestinalis]|uniref:Uncharacterized protein n=1 Tax=Mixta intestinalis TaxID=1615494 RepID=A0A6P1Q0B6_9GAMM|nr:hypothetical protein [Mixta intestinalis]QHM71468.1 hypothetical protein C7M51_01755 [Mixta intestinalis]